MKAIPIDAVPSKLCTFCGKAYPKDPRIAWTRWKKQRFCGKKCAARARGRKTRGLKRDKPDEPLREDIFCEWCGFPLNRRKHETAQQWVKRKYCAKCYPETVAALTASRAAGLTDIERGVALAGGDVKLYRRYTYEKSIGVRPCAPVEYVRTKIRSLLAVGQGSA